MEPRRLAILTAFLTAAACTGVPPEPAPLSRTVPSRPGAAESASRASPGMKDRSALAIAVEREAWVYAAPTPSSAKLGYLRAGERVKRASEATTKDGCAGGWFEVDPRGFVCFDAAWTADPENPIARLYARAPARDGLPYLYVRARYPTPRFYARLPTNEEQRELEPKLDAWLRKYEKLAEADGFVDLPAEDPLPALLASGKPLPGWDGKARGADLDLGRAKRHSGFAVLASYTHEGRRFGLTSDLALTPLDRSAVVEPSALRGAKMGGELDLPLAIVKVKRARRFDADGASADPIDRYAIVPLTGKRLEKHGKKLLETKDGGAVRADQVGEITRYKVAPVWAERGDKWIDVSILKQTLVAYEGKKPVFATLVSTGADGIAGHEGTRATIQGTFLIHTKHLTMTMNSDEQGSEFDLRDVPFVQYFSAGYALHAAYWHDDFGTPRSHGCVNLAPSDAAWLFAWTTPDVPEGWNGALSDAGTLVHIHP
ncbi:MAG: L,D-transpeptidase [Polyangiaceae bacterium]